jgi:hypothetical protein
MPRNLAEEFAARAARYDSEDLFVAENYADLKKHGVLRGFCCARQATVALDDPTATFHC